MIAFEVYLLSDHEHTKKSKRESEIFLECAKRFLLENYRC